MGTLWNTKGDLKLTFTGSQTWLTRIIQGASQDGFPGPTLKGFNSPGPPEWSSGIGI